MRSKLRRLLALVLTLAMVLSLLSTGAVAIEAEAEATEVVTEAEGEPKAEESATQEQETEPTNAPDPTEPQTESEQNNQPAKEPAQAQNPDPTTAPTEEQKEEPTQEPAKADPTQAATPDEPAAVEDNANSMPAFHGEARVGDVIVRVDAKEGIFPAGVHLEASYLPTAEETQDAADAAKELLDEDQIVVSTLVLDVRVVDAEGHEVEPADGKEVEVSFETDRVADENISADVFHIQDDGTAEKLDADVDGEVITATTDSFSTYTVAFYYNTSATSHVIIVTPHDSGKVYDSGADPDLTASYELVGATANEPGEDSFNIKVEREAGENVGQYKITAEVTSVPSGFSVVTGEATFTIYPKPVKVTGITGVDKQYDGTKTADLNTAGATITGADGLTVNATGTFSDSAVGNNKTVTFTMTLGGDNAGNYTISPDSPTTTQASITKKQVNVFGIKAKDKPYDGETAATLTYGELQINGVVNGENVTATATGNFESAAVGQNKTVNITNITLDGADVGNYVLNATGNQTSTTASILADDLSAADVTVNGTYTYNASQQKPTADQLTVTLGGTTLTTDDYQVKSYGPNIDAGTSAGSLVIEGKGRYVGSSKTVYFDIAKAEVTPNNVRAYHKTYDGTPDARVDLTSATLSGVQAVDAADVRLQGTGVFIDDNDDPTAEVGAVRVMINLTLTGDKAKNYKFAPDQDVQYFSAAITADDTIAFANVSVPSYTYNGNKIDPPADDITVTTAGGTVLVKDVDYTIAYGGTNKFVTGNGTDNYFTITGKGSYEGTQTVYFTINPKPVTVTGIEVADKAYDGNTTATLNVTDATITGTVGDTLKVSAIGTFSDAKVGTDKTVTFSGMTLTGTNAENYTISIETEKTGKASIKPKVVTVSGITAQDRLYSEADDSAILNLAPAQINGVVGNEEVAVSATGKFADSSVGKNKEVTITYVELTGADKDNYVLDTDHSQPTTTASILGKDLANATVTIEDVTYNGAQQKPTAGALTVKIGDTTLTTADYDVVDDSYGPNVDVGTGTLTIKGLREYEGTTKDVTFNIVKLPVTVSDLVAKNKVYDPSNPSAAAEVDATNAIIHTAIDGDDVSVQVVSAAFYEGDTMTGEAGTHTVKATIKLVGEKAKNYQLNNSEVTSLSAKITTDINSIATANVSIPAEPYTGAQITPTDFEVRTAAGVLLTKDTDYEIKAYGTNKTVGDNGKENFVTITGKGNYEGEQKVFFTIMPIEVTVTGIEVKTKVYDGTTTATLDTTNVQFAGKLPSDTLTVNVTGTFANANVDTGKVVTFSAMSLGGENASNYKVAADTPTTGEGTITAAPVIVKGITAADKPYDGEATVTLNFDAATFEGKVSSDTLTVTANGAFVDAEVGQNKTVNLSDLVLGGADVDNYVLDTTRSQKTATASITGLSLADADAPAIEDQTYTGERIEPEVAQLTLGDTILRLGTNYAVDPNGYGTNVDVGKGYVTLVGLGAYAGTMKTVEFNIVPKEIEVTGGITAQSRKYTTDDDASAVVDASAAEFDALYSGDAGKVTVNATGVFVDDSDQPTGKTTAAKVKVTMSLSGPKAGNYTLKETTCYADAQITTDTNSITTAIITVKPYTYKGEQIKPAAEEIVVKTLDGKLLVAGTDYEIPADGYGTNLNVAGNGTVNTVTVNGIGNYAGGSQTVDLTIQPAPVKVSGINAMDRAYNGSVAADLNTDDVQFDGTFGSDADNLTVSVTGAFKNATVGEGKVVTFSAITLSGVGSDNYTVSADSQSTSTATISPLPVIISNITAEDRAYQPGVTAATIDCEHARIDTVVGNEVLTVEAEGVFADDKVGNDKPVTITYIRLVGDTKDNYTINLLSSQRTAKASILGEDLADAIVTVTPQTYNSQQLKPDERAVTVTMNGTTLTAGTHYSVDPESYGENINAGTNAGSLIIKGEGIYSGTSKEAYFDITPAPIKVTSGITADSKKYDGTDVAVVHTEGAEFDGIFESDRDKLGITCAGTYLDANGYPSVKPTYPTGKVGLKGFELTGSAASNYTFVLSGSQTEVMGAYITTNPEAIATANVTFTKTYTYTGSQIRPAWDEIEVRLADDNHTLLRIGTDYEIDIDAYGTNVDVSGNDSDNYVTIKGLGIYAPAADATGDDAALGVKKAYFSILPATVTINGISAEDKIYDGTTNATLVTDDVTLGGLVAADAGKVTVTAEEGKFLDPNVGENKTVNISGLALTGEKAGNYLINFTDSQKTTEATITPKEVTISFVDQDPDSGNTGYYKTYGDPDPEYQVVVDGLVEGDSLNYLITRMPGEDAGYYVLNIREVTVQNNYKVTYGTSSLVIEKADLTIDASTVTAKDKPYDGTTTAELDFSDVTLTGVKGSDELVITGTGNFSSAAVGTHPVTIDPDSVKITNGKDQNYNITLENNDGSIEAAITAIPVTVSGITAQNKVYDGTTDATLNVNGAVLEGILDGADVTVANATGTFDDKNVGEGKTVTVSDIVLAGADKDNYDLTGVTLETTANITPKEVTISNVALAEKIYDGTTDANLDSSSATINGLVADDEGKVSVGKITGSFDDAEAGTGKAITFSEVELLGTEAGNYTVDLSEPHMTNAEIKARAITITSDDQEKVYGDTVEPELTWQITEGELVEGDELNIQLIREEGENVREYDINLASQAMKEQNGHGAAAKNYVITYVSGVFTITPAEVTVTADDLSKVYGEDDPELTVTIEGLQRDDDESVITYTIERDMGTGTGEDAGDYAILVSGDEEQGNYTVTFVNGIFTINSREITLTAQNASKNYNDPDPDEFEVEITLTDGTDATGDAVVGSDEINYKIDRFKGEDGGQTYTIFFDEIRNYEYQSGRADSKAPNYHITFVNGTFGINVQPVTIKANDLTMVYGDEVPELTVTVNGAPAALVEYQIELDPDDTAIDQVGEHKIKVTADETQGSFAVTVEEGTLTIKRAPVVVKADDKTKVLGETDPEFTATVTGLKLDDTADDIAYTISRAEGEKVGTYDITPSGEATQGNYEVTYEKGTLTITPAKVTVTGITVADKVYDGKTDAILTYDNVSIDGVADGADVKVVAVGAFEDANAGQGKTVNITKLKLTGADAASYVLDVEESQSTATGNITKAPVTVTPADASKIYGASDPALTATVTGLVEGDTLVYNVERETGEDVGTYQIRTTEGAAQSNYDITWGTATFTISSRDLTLKASSIKAEDKVYDGTTDATLDFSEVELEGVQFKDKLTFSGKGTFESKNVGEQRVAVKASDIKVSGDSAGNYTITVDYTGCDDYYVTTAKITAAEVKVSGITAADRKYNATTTATLNWGSAEIEGLFGDDVTVESAEGNFEDANVGENKTVNITNIKLKGTGAQNYTVVADEEGIQSTTTATIKPVEVTVADVTAADKVYDGTNEAEIDLSSAKIVAFDSSDDATVLIDTNNGTIELDEVEAAFDSANASDTKVTVSIKKITLKGDNKDNYVTRVPSEQHVKARIDMCPVTVKPVAATKVYGTKDPDFTWEIVSVNNNDKVKTLFEYKEDDTTVQDELTLSVTRATGNDVGKYEMSVVGSTQQNGHGGNVPNYKLTFQTGVKFTITKAKATVTANDLSKVYGEDDPDLTAAITGLVNSDTADAIKYTVTRDEGEEAGEYDIHVELDQTEGNAKNYKVTLVDGVFTIKSKEITVTADNANKTYSTSNDPELTATVSPDPIDGDTIEYTLNREKGEDGGQMYRIYFVNPKEYQSGHAGSDAPNYHVTYVEGIFSIGRKVVTVTADNQTMVYGDTVPTLTATVNGAPAAQVEYKVSFDPDDENNAPDKINNVGEHKLIVTAKKIQGSYTVVTKPGILTITPAPVVVTAKDATKVYDKNAANPSSFEATVTGLKLDDTANDITYTISRAEGEKVGTYAITPTGAAEQGNYTVTYVAGTFTITPVTVKVTDGITAEKKTYDGKTDATLDTSAATIKTLVEGDDVTVSATGEFENPNAGLNKKVYIKDLKLVGADAENYILDVDNSQKTTTATIARKKVVVTPEDDTKVYGDPDPIFKVTTKGVVPGDTLAYFIRRDAGESVGTYVIHTAEHAAQTNYIVTYETATFTITSRELTIDASTIKPLDKVYDGTDVAQLDFSEVELTGVQFDDELTFKGTGKFSDKNADEDKDVSVEASDITIGGPRAKNYTITLDYSNTGKTEPVIGTATISPLGIKVSGITAKNRNYDTTAVAELDYSGATFETIIDGDDVKVKSATGTFVDADGNDDPNVGKNKTVSITGIVLDGADGGNYFVLPVEGEQTTATATISPVQVTLVKNSVYAETKTYDGKTDAVLNYKNAKLEVVNEEDAQTLELDQENVAVDKVSGSFASADAGSDKAIKIDTFTLKGDNAKNYETVLPAEGHVVGTIESREITVAPVKDVTKVYGEDDPEKFEWIITKGNLVEYNGELDKLDVTVSRAEGEDAGEYKLTASGAEYQMGHAGSPVAPNYHVTYADDVVFTITPAAVVVTADDFTKVYDNDPTNPEKLTFTVEGLQRDDDESVLTVEVTREEGEDVGTYIITPSGEEEQGNYTVTYVTGKFVITTREITIIADNKEKVYGMESDPEMTATIVGEIAQGDELKYELYRERGEDGGQTYRIFFLAPSVYQSGHEGSTARNYHINYVAGYLGIDRKVVTVVPKHITIQYGEEIPQSEVEINGAPSALIEYKIVLDPSDPNNANGKGGSIGNHKIMIQAEDIQRSYIVKVDTGILTIEPREVELKWGNTKFVYNGKKQLPTATVGNLVEGDTCKVTVTGAQIMPGTYTATAVKLSNPNYVLPDDPTTSFFIDKAKQTAPDAPKVKSVTINSITIYTKSGLEYSIDGGKTWQKSGTFTGLRQNTKYNILARKAETATHYASPASKARPTKTQTHNNVSLLNKNLKLTQKDGAVTVQWGKVPAATSYDIYVVRCGEDFGSKPVARVGANITKFSTTQLKGRAIDQSIAYKALVVARSGNTVLCKSLDVHAAGMTSKNFTNAKIVNVAKTNVSLKRGGSFMINASQILENEKLRALSDYHTSEFRYISSNTSVVRVNANGRITAVGRGSAIVLVLARNMVAKRITVTVK